MPFKCIIAIEGSRPINKHNRAIFAGEPRHQLPFQREELLSALPALALTCHIAIK